MKTRIFPHRNLAALAVVAAVLLGHPTAKSDVFTSASTFVNKLNQGYYFENFAALYTPGEHIVLPSPQSFQGGSPTFQYEIGTSSGQQGMYGVSPVGFGTSLSVLESADDFRVSFTSGNVMAVGGNFFLTGLDYSALNSGTITLTLSDGTIETLPSSSNPNDVFRGFISTVPITSLDIAGPEDQTVEKWVTINNLYVGSIPEPGTFALGALGLVTLLVWRSRSRR